MERGNVIRVKLEGDRDIEKALFEIGSHNTRKSLARRVLKKAAAIFADRANALAPKGRGLNLSTSYGVSSRLTKRQARFARKEGRDDVFMYAGTSDPAGQQQEFGNENHGPQAHARPAWDQTKEAVLDCIQAEMTIEIRKSVERAQRKAARG